MSERIRLVVDGKPAELDADPAMPLLYALRADLARPRHTGAATSAADRLHR